MLSTRPILFPSLHPLKPGYARLVAVTSLYGITFFADGRGLHAARTDELADFVEKHKVRR